MAGEWDVVSVTPIPPEPANQVTSPTAPTAPVGEWDVVAETPAPPASPLDAALAELNSLQSTGPTATDPLGLEIHEARLRLASKKVGDLQKQLESSYADAGQYIDGQPLPPIRSVADMQRGTDRINRSLTPGFDPSRPESGLAEIASTGIAGLGNWAKQRSLGLIDLVASGASSEASSEDDVVLNDAMKKVVSASQKPPEQRSQQDRELLVASGYPENATLEQIRKLNDETSMAGNATPIEDFLSRVKRRVQGGGAVVSGVRGALDETFEAERNNRSSLNIKPYSAGAALDVLVNEVPKMAGDIGIGLAVGRLTGRGLAKVRGADSLDAAGKAAATKAATDTATKTGTLGSMWERSYTLTYNDGLHEGMSPEAAGERAQWHANSEVISEVIPLGMILDARPGKSLMRRLIDAGVSEGVAESATEALQTGYDHFNVEGKEVTLGELMDNMGQAFFGGAVLGTAMRGGTEVLDRKPGGDKPAGKADSIDDLMAGVGEKFKSSPGSDKSTYDAIDEEIGSVKQEVVAALDAMPETTPPEAQYRTVTELLRERGISPAKAPRTMVERIIAAHRQKGGVVRGAGGATEGDVGEIAADVMRLSGLDDEGFDTMPEFMTPKRFAVGDHVETERAGNEKAEQRYLANAVRELEKQGKVDNSSFHPDHHSLYDAIAFQGGLDQAELGGEIDVQTANQGRVGRPVVRKAGTGKSLDHMAESLNELGFRTRTGERLDPNSLTDLIDEESRGRRVFSADRQNVGMFDADRNLSAFAGGDPKKLASYIRKYLSGADLGIRQRQAIAAIIEDGYESRQLMAAKSDEMPAGQSEAGTEGLAPALADVGFTVDDRGALEAVRAAYDASIPPQSIEEAIRASGGDVAQLAAGLEELAGMIPESATDRARASAGDNTGARRLMETLGSLKAVGDAGVEGALQKAGAQRPKRSAGRFEQPFKEDVRRRMNAAAETAYRHNVDPEAAAAMFTAMFPDAGIDPVTGFYKAEQRAETMDRAKEYLNNSNVDGFYIEVDLSNLGGLNTAKGHSGGNKIYRRIARVLSSALSNGLGKDDAAYDQVNFRHGGDEMSFFVFGDTLNRSSIEEILRRAQETVWKYARSEGVHEIPHAKHKDDPTKVGVNFYFGVAPIVADQASDQIFGQADKQVESSKKESSYGYRKRKAAGAVRSESGAARRQDGRAGETERRVSRSRREGEQGASGTPESAGDSGSEVRVQAGSAGREAALDEGRGEDQGSLNDGGAQSPAAAPPRNLKERREREAQDRKGKLPSTNGIAAEAKKNADLFSEDYSAAVAGATPKIKDSDMKKAARDVFTKVGYPKWLSERLGEFTDAIFDSIYSATGRKFIQYPSGSEGGYRYANESDVDSGFTDFAVEAAMTALGFKHATRDDVHYYDDGVNLVAIYDSVEPHGRMPAIEIEEFPISEMRDLREQLGLEDNGNKVEERKRGDDKTSDLFGEPTEAQKAAGNYKKDHIRMHGLDIAIENRRGSVRRGKDENGREWENTLAHDYGYIKRTEGNDGDHVDVFVGTNLTSDKVFVVNQTGKGGAFDEHKVMLGFSSAKAAEDGYLANYDAGWDRFDGVVPMSIEQLKDWLKSGDQKKPAAAPAEAQAASTDLFGKTEGQAAEQRLADAAAEKKAKEKRDAERASKMSDGPLFDGTAEQKDALAAVNGQSPVATERFAAGAALTKDERKHVLASLTDVYVASGHQKEQRVRPGGEEYFAYPHAPELFEKSDITGAMVRYYVTLPDGRKAHPTELFPDYTQAEIDAVMARRETERKNILHMLKGVALNHQFDSAGGVSAFYDSEHKKNRGVSPSSDREIYSKGGKFIAVPRGYLEAGSKNAQAYIDALANEGWKKEKPSAGKLDESEAIAILDAADVRGKDRLEALEKFRTGIYTLDDLKGAYPAKAEAGDKKPWEMSQDEFVNAVDFRKSTGSNPWTAWFGEAQLEAGGEEFDHPGLGRTVVMGGRFFKTKREAEVAARGAHKRAVRRALINGYDVPEKARSDYPDLRAEPESAGGKKPAKVTPQVASDRQLASMISIAADSIGDLRAIDVDRVLSEAPVQFRVALANHIKSKRKDLVAAVDEAMSDLAGGAGPASEIQDFGEKIGGARKDVWSSFKDKMKAAESLDIAAEPLSKTWPVPDYQALLDSGSDPWAVAFLHAVRDEIPTKPKKGWKLKSWVAKVEMLRDLGTKVIDGQVSAETARKKLFEASKTSRGLMDVADRAELYQLVGHEKSLSGVRVSSGEYSIFNGVQYKPAKIIWSVEKDAKATAFSNWPRQLANGDTRAEAIANFKAKYSELEITPTTAKGTTFEIYSKRGEEGYWVGKKVGRNPILLKGGFASVKEARAYKDAHNDELVKLLEKHKEIPRERRDVNNPRVGEDMRQGKDVTPAMFSEAFGFRGVEFGNWVDQKKRQKDLNDAFDALMDMAAVIGVNPKALSLNGELGLAFGARGRGGVNAAAAHFERDFFAINLTKNEGAGSLGHEWWHALDNYFSRMRGKPDDMMTDALDVSLAARGSKFVHEGAVRKEMIEAYGAVLKAINDTNLRKRSRILDSRRSKEYWITPVEMSARTYESYLIAKLQDQGASNDYLANIVDEETWRAAEQLGFELENSYPYPLADESPVIRAAFDAFFSTIETRETDKGLAIYEPTRGYDGGDAVRAKRKEIEGGETGKLQRRRLAAAQEQGDLFTASAIPAAERAEALADIYHAVVDHEEVGRVDVGHEVIDSAGKAAWALRHIGRRAQEQMLVLVTDAQHRPISIISHTSGTRDSSVVDTGVLVGAIVAQPGAKHYWLAHNHPSGKVDPSRNDRLVTNKILELTSGTGLLEKGHLVIGRDDTWYFNNTGTSDQPIARKEPAGSATNEVPIVERFITRYDAGDQIASTADAIRIASSMKGSGVVLLDAQLHVVGYVPMSEDEMSYLKNTSDPEKSSPLYRLLAAIDKTNANGILIKGGTEHSANNIGKFGSSASIRVIDWVSESRGKPVSMMDKSGWSQPGSSAFYSLSGGMWRSGLRDAVEAAKDGLPMFRMGQPGSSGARVSELAKAIDAASNDILGLSAKAVQSIEDLPSYLVDAIDRKASRGEIDPSKIEGLFDPSTGKTFVIADNVSGPERAIEVALHEDVGHFGARVLLGDKHQEVMLQIERSFRDDPRFQDVRRRYGLGNLSKEDRALAADEFVARMAESGTLAAMAKDKPLGAIGRLFRAIREALQRLKLIRWTDADIERLLARSVDAIGRRRAVEAGDQSPTFAIAAWHGSPHEFDEFSLKHMGSGEGAQAYGWGLYFAGKKDVADWYRVNLTARHTGDRFMAFGKRYSSVQEAKADGVFTAAEIDLIDDAELQDSISSLGVRDGLKSFYRSATKYGGDKAIADSVMAKMTPDETAAGRLYRVEIPDDDQYLLWDKPLSEQSDNVRAAIERAMEDSALDDYSRTVLKKGGKGAAIYEALKVDDNLGETAEAASKYLHGLGIAGIKYLDGTSRGAASEDWLVKSPSGMVHRFASKAAADAYIKGRSGYKVTEPSAAYNYVLFDDSAIRIDARFSLSGGSRSGTQSPEFKEWFGKSKILNDDGTPMVMYHATYNGGFPAFDRLWSTKVRAVSMDTVGSWFSDNPGEGGAGMYANGAGASVYPVYLRAEKTKYYDRFDDFLSDMHEAEGRKLKDQNPKGLGSAEGLRKKLKAEGYDSIGFTGNGVGRMFEEVDEIDDAIKRAKQDLRDESGRIRTLGQDMTAKDAAPFQAKIDRLTEKRQRIQQEIDFFGRSSEFDNQRVIVVFDPEQIKSVFNRGTFDRKNPDIRFSLSGGGKQAPATGSKEFKEWFGDSKVVDANGKPLVVYHGTSANFSEFDTSDFGSWFAVDPSTAAEYTHKGQHDYEDAAEKIVPVYLSVENPFYIPEDADLSETISVSDFVNSINERNGVRFTAKMLGLKPDYEGNGFEHSSFNERFIEVLKERGHDGIFAYEGGSPTWNVFTSEQVKSVFNSGTFDRNNQDIRFSLSGGGGNTNTHAAGKQSRSDAKAARQLQDDIKETHAVPEGRGLVDRTRDAVARMTDWNMLAFKQGFIDSFASIAALETNVNGGLLDAGDSAYKAALMTKNHSGVMATILHHKQVKLDGGWFGIDESSQGFMSIFEPLAKEPGMLRLWEHWAGAVRAKRLMAEGRERNYTQEQIDRVLAFVDERPELKRLFNETHRQWRDFNNRTLDMAEAAGVIDPAERKLWSRDDYVPFYRVLEDQEEVKAGGKVQGLSGQTSGVRRLKGSEAKVSILESMVLNTMHLVDASYKNVAMRKVVDLAEGLAMERVDMDWKPVKMTDAQLAGALRKHGIEVEKLDESQREAWSTLFTRTIPQGRDIVSVMRDGKREWYRVTDPLLLRAVTAMGPDAYSRVTELLGMPKQWLTTMVTADPGFMIRNFMRDTLSTWVTVKPKGLPKEYSKLVLVDAVRGAVKSFRNSDSQWAVMAAGAGNEGQYSVIPEDVRRALTKINGLQSTLGTPGKVWHFWQRVGRSFEYANRLAVHENVRKAGGSEAEAAFQAMDVLNFSRRGEWTTVRWLTAVVPFLNARIQGIDRLYRGAQENPAAFAAKGALLMAATMALMAANEDDDRYWALPEWDRDTYWHFWVGNEHFRIPKPFEVGAVFATIPERIWGQASGKEDLDILSGAALRMVAGTFAFNPVPQAFMPAVEAAANASLFRGWAPIVNEFTEEFKAPEEQFDPWTSESMRVLADWMPDAAPDFMRSPMKLEHMVRGYFGTLGSYVLMGSDHVARWLGSYPEGPDTPVAQMPVIGSFWRNGETATKYPAEFYEMLKEVNQVHNRIKTYSELGLIQEAKAEFRKNGLALKTREAMNSAQKEMSDLKKQIREIYADESMSGEAKRDAIYRLHVRRNEVAKLAVERFGSFYQ